MKTLVIFYSYTGKTRELASKKAVELGADIIEVKETKKRGKINAYVVGCFQAMKQKKATIEPIDTDLNTYEKIIIMMPIWAGHPAPAFNNIASILPAGKQVELIMTSGSGNSGGSAEKTKALIKASGCKVTEYIDVKS